MKYIITESQLRSLIKEQQGVIKLNLGKDEDNTKLNTYCKPILMDKKIIDKHIGKVDTEIEEYINDFKRKYSKEYPEISDYMLDIDKIVSDVKPLISATIKKNIYTKFSHLNYNDKNDMNLIFKKIYTALDNALQSNFVKKMAIKAFITNKNVDGVKRGVGEFFRNFKLLMVKLRYWIPRIISRYVYEDHTKVAPKCTNLLVVNDQYGYKVTPYNPTRQPLTKNMDYVELDTLLEPYIASVNKIIDSFV
jgi:hypothetical protein